MWVRGRINELQTAQSGARLATMQLGINLGQP
jgi:hypothetical protein